MHCEGGWLYVIGGGRGRAAKTAQLKLTLSILLRKICEFHKIRVLQNGPGIGTGTGLCLRS